MSPPAPAPSSGLSGVAVFVTFLILLLARRTYRMVRGTVYSLPRLVVFAGFYVLLFLAFGTLTISAAIGTWGAYGAALVAPYGGIVVVASIVAAPYVRRIVRFERRADGRWYYRLPWAVPLLTLVLFVARFAAEIAVLGLAATTSLVLPTSLPAGVLLVLVGIDLTFGVSVGLLIGRAIGVHRAFGALPTAPEPMPSPPLPSG